MPGQPKKRAKRAAENAAKLGQASGADILQPPTAAPPRKLSAEERKARRERIAAVGLKGDDLEEFLELLRKGNYRKTACSACGILPKLFEQWMRRADNDEPEFVELKAEILEAEASWEIYATELIRLNSEGLGRGDGRAWQAAAWMLERRAGGHWNEKAILGSGGDEDARREALNAPATVIKLAEPPARLRVVKPETEPAKEA